MKILEVAIVDPQVYGGWMRRHVRYRLVTTSLTGGSQCQQHSVRRRYREFDRLRRILVQEYPGHLIPPLPPATVNFPLKPLAIEARRIGLERFLQNIIATGSPLAESPLFLAFLTEADWTCDAYGRRGVLDGVYKTFITTTNANLLIYHKLSQRLADEDAINGRMAAFKTALEEYRGSQEDYSRSLHATSRAMAQYLQECAGGGGGLDYAYNHDANHRYISDTIDHKHDMSDHNHIHTSDHNQIPSDTSDHNHIHGHNHIHSDTSDHNPFLDTSNTVLIQFMSALDQVASCVLSTADGDGRAVWAELLGILEDHLAWGAEVHRVWDHINRERGHQVRARSATIDAEAALLVDQVDQQQQQPQQKLQHQLQENPMVNLPKLDFDRTYHLTTSLLRARSQDSLVTGRLEGSLRSFSSDLDGLGLRRIEECSEIIDGTVTEAAFRLNEIAKVWASLSAAMHNVHPNTIIMSSDAPNASRISIYPAISTFSHRDLLLKSTGSNNQGKEVASESDGE